jgi:hypothetical protein
MSPDVNTVVQIQQMEYAGRKLCSACVDNYARNAIKYSCSAAKYRG